MPDPAPTVTIVQRLSDAGLYHKEIAALACHERSMVSHWHSGRRTMPLEALARLAGALLRRWPERRLFWAELLLGDLARIFGCRIVPDGQERPAAKVVHLDADRQARIAAAQALLTQLLQEAA